MKRKQSKLTRRVIYEAGVRCGSADNIVLMKILNQIHKYYEKKAIKAQSDKGTS